MFSTSMAHLNDLVEHWTIREPTKCGLASHGDKTKVPRCAEKSLVRLCGTSERAVQSQPPTAITRSNQTIHGGL